MAIKILLFICFIGLLYPNIGMGVLAFLIFIIFMDSLEKANKEFNDKQKEIKDKKIKN